MLLNAKMVMGRLVIAGVVGAAMLVSAPLVSAQEAEFTAIQRLPPTTFVPGEVIVRLRPGTSEQSRDQVLAMVDGIFVRSLGPVGSHTRESAGRHGGLVGGISQRRPERRLRGAEWPHAGERSVAGLRHLVPKMPHVGEDHRKAFLVGGGDDLVVAKRAARLDHCGRAGFGRGQ